MAFTDRLHNRGSISTGFDIDNSLKFEPDNSEFIYRFPSQEGSDQKRMAFSIWLKRTELGTAQTFMLFGNGGSNSTRLDIGFDTSDRLQIRNVNSNWRLTTQVFRDTSAWYHLFFQFNTLDTTADDRIKVWVNGNLIAIADYTTVNDPGYDATLGFNRNYKNVLGGRQFLDNSTDQFFAGYIAQVYGSGGTPPAVTDFGEFDEDTGIWKPKDISGISPPEPINGFFLDFTDASDLGNDASGNNNNWTLNNITSADQATDTPTNNFCILNANSALPNQSNYMIVSEGGTLTQKSGGANWTAVRGSIGINGGKWYWEATRTGTNNTAFGIVQISDSSWAGASTIFSLLSNGRLYGAGTSPYLTAPPAFSFTDGDTVAIALDLDNQRAYLSKNGVWQNSADPANGTNPINLSLPDEFVLPWTASYYSEPTMQFNFGSYTIASISSAESDENGYGTFEYAPPSGFYALCTKNLAEYG